MIQIESTILVTSPSFLLSSEGGSSGRGLRGSWLTRLHDDEEKHDEPSDQDQAYQDHVPGVVPSEKWLPHLLARVEQDTSIGYIVRTRVEIA